MKDISQEELSKINESQLSRVYSTFYNRARTHYGTFFEILFTSRKSLMPMNLINQNRIDEYTKHESPKYNLIAYLGMAMGYSDNLIDAAINGKRWSKRINNLERGVEGYLRAARIAVALECTKLGSDIAKRARGQLARVGKITNLDIAPYISKLASPLDFHGIN